MSAESPRPLSTPTFVCVGDQGINLDQVESWSYQMPTPTARARTIITFMSGSTEYFHGLAADALNWWLSKDASDLERAYVNHWSAIATHATQTARAQAKQGAQDEAL